MGARKILLLLSVLFVAVHGKKDCCKLSGNGNYHQFDKGPMVHFRSNCTYNFASDINKAFQVWVDTEFHHDNPAVSFAYSTIIHYNDSVYVLTVDDVIMPDGTTSAILGFQTYDNGIIRIEHIGQNIKFTIYQEDLELFWHGAHNLEVCLDNRWSQNPSTMNGLCGNYNGNKDDDLVTSGGDTVQNNFDGYDEFGESWAVDWQDETAEDCGKPPGSWKVCSVVLDPHGYTVDGAEFKVTDVCTYDLALYYANLNISMETYRRNIIDERRNVSFVRRLIIQHNGVEYSMYPEKLYVDDDEKTIPYSDANFNCTLGMYKFCCVSNTRPFKACSDRKFSFYLHFEYFFYKALSGLCGNFNDNPNDDYILRDGTPADGMEDFVQSWETPDCQ